MAPMKTSTKTLLALTAAAAFGGFAATGLHLALDAPAAAQPGAATAIPAAGALPNVVAGTPMPSLAPVMTMVFDSVTNSR